MLDVPEVGKFVLLNTGEDDARHVNGLQLREDAVQGKTPEREMEEEVSVNLSALAAIKAKLTKKTKRQSQISDVALAELGIDEEPVVCHSPQSNLALMAKMKSQHAQNRTVRNCGNCVRWLDCTKLHRAHRVSPNLSACDAHEFSK